jgi:hypothetical protein
VCDRSQIGFDERGTVVLSGFPPQHFTDSQCYHATLAVFVKRSQMLIFSHTGDKTSFLLLGLGRVPC